MAKGNVTKSTVDGLAAGERDAFLWDTKVPGFGVKVTPSGSKVYLYQYRMGGRGSKVRRYTIGKHGPITPDAARTEAKRLAGLVLQGVDPQAEKTHTRKIAVDLAFPSYLDRFAAECLKVEWQASADEVEAMLRGYALPALKSKALPDITAQDISATLRPLKAKPASRSKLFAVLRRLFRWAVSQGDLGRSPMTDMEAPPVPKARDRVLADWELVLIWASSAKMGHPFGRMTHLLMLTGARRNEVSGIPWPELSRDDKRWTLPASRSKNGEASENPLSYMAVAVIDEGHAIWPRKGLLFSTTGNTPVSGYSRAKSRLDKLVTKANGGEPLEHWTLHDLRRTLATGMQRLGVRFEVTEAILNHKSGSRSGVTGIYQRHDWGPEKREALGLWAAHIDALNHGKRPADFAAKGDEEGIKGWRSYLAAWAVVEGMPPDDKVVLLADRRA